MKTPSEILHTITTGIVRNPESVFVDESFDDNTGDNILTLTVHPKDMGLVIGRDGGMIRAIRWIMTTVSINSKQHILINVNDPRAKVV